MSDALRLPSWMPPKAPNTTRSKPSAAIARGAPGRSADTARTATASLADLILGPPAATHDVGRLAFPAAAATIKSENRERLCALHGKCCNSIREACDDTSAQYRRARCRGGRALLHGGFRAEGRPALRHGLRRAAGMA